jgi:DmsE family decaheme c-type cytochrome
MGFEAMIRRMAVVAMAWGFFALALATAAPAQEGAGAPAPGAGQPQYDPKGAEGCLKCHDKGPVLEVLRTPHAMQADARTPFADHACETCHGPSPEHLVKPPEGEPRAPTAVTFTKGSQNTVAERNAVCLGCHSGGSQMNWTGSPHHLADVACASCHHIHVRRDEMLEKREQAEVCFTCHLEQRAQSRLPSRHPILEGLTACSDCHSAHGGITQHLLAGATVNDTCYTCHAELRGPFLWEHAPAREDCTLCHFSHGSVNPGLLKVRAPFLCQECHMAPYHSSSLYDGSRLGNPIPQRELLGRSCMNCHSQVHGSNHPSGVRALR